jgi:hypothetical protein
MTDQSLSQLCEKLRELLQRVTPGEWQVVPSDEHHGPYVCGEHGGDIADCYVMSKPGALSVRNGGDSAPIHFFAEMADPNAALIALAPTMAAALLKLRENETECVERLDAMQFAINQLNFKLRRIAETAERRSAYGLQRMGDMREDWEMILDHVHAIATSGKGE